MFETLPNRFFKPEEESFTATILDIVPASERCGRGDGPVALIEKNTGERAEYPLATEHDFAPGDPVEITPEISRDLPGPLTTYRVEHLRA